MIVLARAEGESLRIADGVEIKVLSIRGRIVRLGFKVPEGVYVERIPANKEQRTTRIGSDDRESNTTEDV